jgi:hypothetical protein
MPVNACIEGVILAHDQVGLMQAGWSKSGGAVETEGVLEILDFTQRQNSHSRYSQVLCLHRNLPTSF